MHRYVALLRGINVGGRNVISMAELRASFEEAGYDSVATYIQSGNVVFASDEPASAQEASIEAFLQQRFDVPLTVVVRSRRQLRGIVAKAPKDFGADSDTYSFDVIFLKAPLTARRALEVFDPREGVDRIWSGTGVIYSRRLKARASQSRLSRIAGTRHYSSMTIRNWRTTTKLLELLDEL